MGKILSIIIPSYNMEGYLGKCLSSLMCGNIDKLDIIIVNDGSKDKTAEIATGFVNKHPRSISLIDKPNGNYGSCINAALKVAQGKYVKVLDADDSFTTGVLDMYIDYLSTINSDLAISDYCRVTPAGKERNIRFNNIDSYKETPFRQAVQFLQKESFSMHAVAYKTDLLRRIDYRQTEGVSYTDMEWMFLPMTQVNTLSYFPHVLYRYLIGREGQTVSTALSIKAVNQTATVVESMLEKYAHAKDSLPEIHRKYLEARLRLKTPSIYRIYLLKQSDSALYPDLHRFDQVLQRTYPRLYSDLDRENIKGIPFHFITHWRKHYEGAKTLPILSLLSRIYNAIF